MEKGKIHFLEKKHLITCWVILYGYLKSTCW
jgi:hypothetical protein